MDKAARNAVAAAFALVCALAAGTGVAQNQPFNIKPLVLDTADGKGTTIGLAWELADTLYEQKLDPNSIDRKSITVDYKLTGVVTPDKERNPKNFNDGSLQANYLNAGAGKVDYMAGAFVKYEADQNLDNRQSVYGLHGTVFEAGLLRKSGAFDYVALDANFGRVDPRKDLERQAVLGTSDLSGYYRWDVEFLYVFPLTGKLRALEFNFRYFREVDAPQAIRAANLHEHKLRTFRLGLTTELFIAYSKGNLPFDKSSDKIFEIGWSQNLKD